MSDFASFLQKMDTETNGYKKPQPVVEEPVYEEEEDEYEEEIDEEVEEEEYNEPEEDFSDEEELDEEVLVERAFDYARIFMKTIRENFSDKHQRRVILETVGNAINMSLGSNQQPVVEQRQSQQEQPKKPQMMSEKDWNNIPNVQADENVQIRMNDFSNQPAPQVQYQTSEESGSGYNRNVKLGLKMGKNGQPEVDTSQMTNEDVADMRVLAGIEEVKE